MASKLLSEKKGYLGQRSADKIIITALGEKCDGPGRFTGGRYCSKQEKPLRNIGKIKQSAEQETTSRKGHNIPS